MIRPVELRRFDRKGGREAVVLELIPHPNGRSVGVAFSVYEVGPTDTHGTRPLALRRCRIGLSIEESRELMASWPRFLEIAAEYQSQVDDRLR